MATDQNRKAGDALILSGQLKGSVGLLSSDAAWEGVLASIHIIDAATKEVIRNDATVVITPPVTATKTNARYRYVGAPLVVGKYLYEIEIPLPTLPAPLTAPNNNTQFKLNVFAQYA